MADQLSFSKPDDICRNRHGGNPESEAANASVHRSKETIRREIIKHALHAGGEGITADEIAEAWGCTHNHVAPRISELRRDGRLVETKERRMTRSGRWARVLVIRGYAK